MDQSTKPTGESILSPLSLQQRIYENLRRELLRNRFPEENIRSSGISIDQEAIIAAMSARDMIVADILGDDFPASAAITVSRFADPAIMIEVQGSPPPDNRRLSFQCDDARK